MLKTYYYFVWVYTLKVHSQPICLFLPKHSGPLSIYLSIWGSTSHIRIIEGALQETSRLERMRWDKQIITVLCFRCLTPYSAQLLVWLAPATASSCHQSLWCLGPGAWWRDTGKTRFRTLRCECFSHLYFTKTGGKNVINLHIKNLILSTFSNEISDFIFTTFFFFLQLMRMCLSCIGSLYVCLK